MAYQTRDIIHNQYLITEILDRSSTAITYQAINQKTKSFVAIKVISLKQLSDWKQIELFKKNYNL